MNQVKTKGIVLTRVDYGEADRIITVLTSDQGKLSLMAKGVRRVKSKLAGGIELLSVSEIVYMPSRSSLNTLISARLIKHYGNIVGNIDRTMMAYDILKQTHKSTEDDVEVAYFTMLENALAALDDFSIPLELVSSWTGAQLLRFGGHTPNLTHDVSGEKLQAGKRYDFDFEAVGMVLAQGDEGSFDTDRIKFFRLLFTDSSPQVIARVQGSAGFAAALNPLLTSLRQFYLNI